MPTLFCWQKKGVPFGKEHGQRPEAPGGDQVRLGVTHPDGQVEKAWLVLVQVEHQTEGLLADCGHLIFFKIIIKLYEKIEF